MAIWIFASSEYPLKLNYFETIFQRLGYRIQIIGGGDKRDPWKGRRALPGNGQRSFCSVPDRELQAWQRRGRRESLSSSCQFHRA